MFELNSPMSRLFLIHAPCRFASYVRAQSNTYGMVLLWMRDKAPGPETSRCPDPLDRLITPMKRRILLLCPTNEWETLPEDVVAGEQAQNEWVGSIARSQNYWAHSSSMVGVFPPAPSSVACPRLQWITDGPRCPNAAPWPNAVGAPRNEESIPCCFYQCTCAGPRYLLYKNSLLILILQLTSK